MKARHWFALLLLALYLLLASRIVRADDPSWPQPYIDGQYLWVPVCSLSEGSGKLTCIWWRYDAQKAYLPLVVR